MITLKVTQEITISERALELLKELEKGGYAEYRDRYATVDEFVKSDEYEPTGIRTIEWFKNRNCGGTYNEAMELLTYDLIDDGDGMAWHSTYFISEKGKILLEQNK